MSDDSIDFSPMRRVLLAGMTGSALLGSAYAAAKPIASKKDSSHPSLAGEQIPAHGLASYAAGEALRPFAFKRRAMRPNDVVIEIHFCGVCHSDIHVGHNDWSERHYPIVPGHEIAGIVIGIGSAVSNFRIGDRVGVGAIVDSCGTCPTCRDGHEQYCENDALFTHGSDSAEDPGGYTQGGYANVIVVHDKFVVHVPDQIELAAAGPIMCAAVSVYSPLRHWQIRPGHRIGVVGLGGLGHMAVQLAKAMGAEVIVFTTSPDKVADARRFGAADVVINTDTAAMKRYVHQLDFILDTAPYQHDLNALIRLLRHSATLCLVGIGRAVEPNQLSPFATIGRRASFAGSLIGSMRETQEAMDFCAAHGIRPAINLIPVQKVNEAWELVVAKKARYRYVIDLRASFGA